jgi:hypothetical protein
MSQNVFKLNDMAVLLYCFVQDTNNSHHRVLTKVAEYLQGKGREVMPSILARLFLFESDEISPEIYSFYYQHAARGLHHSSATTRTKSISILSYLVRVRLEPILPLLPILEKQIK